MQYSAFIKLVYTLKIDKHQGIHSVLNNLSVKSRLIAIAFTPIIVMVVLSLESLWIMSGLNDGIKSLHEDRVIPLRQLKLTSDMYAVDIVDS